MAISDITGPFDEDDREEQTGGDDGHESFEDGADDAPFAEEEARENANEILQDDELGGELPFAEDEARLPWLEGDEDDEPVGGYGSGQTVGLIIAALLGLAVIAGGIWWFTRDTPDAELVADGSTIESEGPYKERPDDPGGKVFEGTDDSSFKVAEGQTSPARLGDGDAEAQPGFESLGKDKNEKTGKAAADDKGGDKAPAATAVDKPAVGVQVGAYSDRASAEAGWSRLSGQYEALKGLRHRVVEGKADIGTVYRLQALADDTRAAGALCSKLKASGLACYVKP